MAIAKVENAECIYSNDDDLVRLAKRDGIPVILLNQLPEPQPDDGKDQTSMFYVLDDGAESAQ
jgi:hypothetical protein